MGVNPIYMLRGSANGSLIIKKVENLRILMLMTLLATVLTKQESLLFVDVRMDGIHGRCDILVSSIVRTRLAGLDA